MLSGFISKYISNRKAYHTEYVFGLDIATDAPSTKDAKTVLEGKGVKSNSRAGKSWENRVTTAQETDARRVTLSYASILQQSKQSESENYQPTRNTQS